MSGDRFAMVPTEHSMMRLWVVDFEGATWLVPGWDTHKTKPLKRPHRMIKMTGLRYQKSDVFTTGVDYVLNDPIPRAIIMGEKRGADTAPFEVIEDPRDVVMVIDKGN